MIRCKAIYSITILGQLQTCIVIEFLSIINMDEVTKPILAHLFLINNNRLPVITSVFDKFGNILKTVRCTEKV